MSLKMLCVVFLSFSFMVNAKSDKFSFSLAIDNTASMQGEIDGVKRAATRILDAVLKSGSKLIENYVLVTINDPYVKLRTVTKNPDVLKRELDSIVLESIHNYDCPELALQGVEMAIENSLPRSLVYVFTDADAKDAHLLEKVRNLAYRKQIQLVFVLTEHCYTRADYDPTYTTLATATNGIVFEGDKSTKVDEILNYAVESVTKRRILIGKGTFPPGAHNMNVTVDPTMPDVIGMGFGKNVVLGKVYNPDGTLAHTESVIDTPDAKAIKVNCTQPGKYDFHFESKSNTSVIFQASTSLDFYHGFSSKKPLSIPGTSMLPLPDVKSHLAIDVKSDEEVLIEKVELHDLSQKLILEMPLEKVGKKFYVTEPFIPPSGLFYITIKGVLLKSKTPIKRTSSTPVETQNRRFVKTEDKSPTITMEKAIIDAEYDQPLTITCDVQAYPIPTIAWYDNVDNEVSSNVENYEIPYGYKNTLELSNVDKNTTYTCKAKNMLGQVTSMVTINTKRKNYFDVLTRPSDITIEYKQSGKVSCLIDSDPPSTISWARDSKELVSDSKMEISSDKTQLNIKEMSPDLVGTYNCIADNGVNSTDFSFKILIDGVAPTVTIDVAKVELEYDEPIHVDCKITGFPEPKVVWKDLDTGAIISSLTKKSDDLKYDYMNTLEIVQSKKNTTYQCFASNDKGDDSKTVEIQTGIRFNILEEPKDINIEFKRSGTIKCQVDANPFAKLTWVKNGVQLLSNDSFNITENKDGSSTMTINDMRPFLEGIYVCQAANDFQTEEMKFDIVLTGTAPKTSIDWSPKINAEYDAPLQILCKVSGYPEPEIAWHDKGTGEVIVSDPSNVEEPYDYGKTLLISAVIKNATYTCLAKNPLGEHSTEIQVETKRKTYFIIQVSPKDTKIEYRKSAKINCLVDSYPPSTITWNKGDKEITVDSNIEIIDNATTLHIKRATEEISGTYSCKAQNGHNSSAVFFNIDILGVAPVVSMEGGAQQIVEYDATVNLECKVTGFPAPKIIWKEVDSGNIIPSTTVSSVDKEYDFVSILHIDNAERNATYQCSAANAKGADSEDVEVAIKVYLNILKAPKDLNVQFRKNGRTKCKVDASPPAIITWHKDGIKIRSDGNFDVVYGSDGSSTLLIDNMRPHMAGKYSCRAANDFMAEDIEFQIMVTGIAAKTSISEAPKINAEYDEPLSLLCEVSGYPEPQIIWQNNETGKEVHSSPAPVNPAYDHGKILQIDKVNKNETYTCKAKNSLGEHTTEVQIVTVRKTYFDVLVEPKNTTIKYKENGQVFCDVKANPPADIIWYKGSMELKNETQISISQNRTVLSITDMQPILGGSYTCRPNNKDNDVFLNFMVNIIGIIKPEIDKSIDQVKVVEGSMAVIPCRIVRGDPVPTISWRFRAETDTKYNDLKESGSEIAINNVSRNHAGAYRCSANNAGGPDKLTIDLVVEYPPTIKIRNKKSVSLMQGQTKILYCDASGEPQPTVTWLLNDAPVSISEYEIYSDESIKIEASVHNVGKFTCLAKNEHGEATITTTVDYTAPVQIDIPKDTKIEVLEGEEIKMPCVADGYPQPKIQWKFLARNASSPKLLKDAYSPDTLVMPAQLERAGYYVCTAQNGKSVAKSLTYEVIVNAPPKILEKDTSKIFRAVKGDLVLRIPCAVTGWPKPAITWIKNGLFIPSGTEWYDIADDGTLLIKNIDEGGSYFCTANNKHGSDSKSFEVQLDEFPTPSPPSETMRVYIGDTAHIKCDLPHQLVDQLRWYKDGKLLFIGELTLNKVGTKDAGLYTCRVSTLSGSDSSTVMVEVLLH